MESGLEGRNNGGPTKPKGTTQHVSMESGLEGRNNVGCAREVGRRHVGLNGVRPRRPEQCCGRLVELLGGYPVSMESGLEGRNNQALE